MQIRPVREVVQHSLQFIYQLVDSPRGDGFGPVDVASSYAWMLQGRQHGVERLHQAGGSRSHQPDRANEIDQAANFRRSQHSGRDVVLRGLAMLF